MLEVTAAPASPQETDDEDLVARAWQGDGEALGLLLERYRPFVRRKARSYFLAGGDRQDVAQEGMIGLYKAVRDFDAAREASFRSFAELCITRQILTAVKSATRRKHSPLNTYVSLHGPVHTGEDPEAVLMEHVAAQTDDPAESVVSRQELARLQRYCGEILSDLEASVLQRYLEGESYQEIAAALHRHVKSVDNALQRIKRKLDCYLEERRLQEAV